MKKFQMALLMAMLVGCGKGGGGGMGSDGKCSVKSFRPFGTSHSTLTANERALAIKTLQTKAEAYYAFIFLIADPKKPTVFPGDQITAAAKAAVDAGKCTTVRDPIVPPKGQTKSERSLMGESCPVNVYLIQDELKGEIFEGESSAKQHRLTRFNDLSLSKNDLIGMKYDGDIGGDVEIGDIDHSSICESFQGELETKSLGVIPLYASEEARHAFRKDYDLSKPETVGRDNESTRLLRRGFKFADFVAEFEVEYHSKYQQETKLSVTLNGVPLSSEELSVLGKDLDERFRTLSAN